MTRHDLEDSEVLVNNCEFFTLMDMHNKNNKNREGKNKKIKSLEGGHSVKSRGGEGSLGIFADVGRTKG